MEGTCTSLLNMLSFYSTPWTDLKPRPVVYIANGHIRVDWTKSDFYLQK